MQGKIHLAIVRDADGSAELSVAVWSKDFSGRGTSYFDLELLSEKARQFAAYPLPDDSLELSGGFLERADVTKLRQEHLSIAAYPLGRLGKIGLRVTVAEPCGDGRGVLSRSTTVEFIAQYEQLSMISAGLAAMVEGRMDVFEVEFPE